MKEKVKSKDDVLITASEIAKEYGMNSRGAVFSATRARGLCSVKKEGRNVFYNADDVRRAFTERPLKRKQASSCKDDTPLLGKRQPFRDLKCSRYEGCYSGAAYSGKPLDCSKCIRGTSE